MPPTTTTGSKEEKREEEEEEETFTFTVFTPSAEDGVFTPPTLPQLNNLLRRSTRTLRNRLHAIAADSVFVARVGAAYGLPLVPNARAGNWYVPSPQHGQVYFKSTDGHYGRVAFSLRRLNAQLLCANQGRGAVVVDSTRRGKRFPDALAKTVPVWCAVVNALLFPERFERPVLDTIPLAVSEQERRQIEGRLEMWVEEAKMLGVDWKPMIKKPWRPIWVSPESTLPDSPPDWEAAEYTPLILCTASRMVKGEGTEGEYIQGAGDDHEGWAGECGLTPEVFWAHAKKILAAGEDEIGEAVAAAVAAGIPDASSSNGNGHLTCVRPTASVFVAARPELEAQAVPPGLLVVNCCEKPLAMKAKGNVIIHVPIAAGKKGNKALRTLVPPLLQDRRLLDSLAGEGAVFACEDGNDVAPAVAAVVLCAFFDGDGSLMETPRRKEDVDKTLVKQRLAWISTARPLANPARGLVSGVHSVLMGWEGQTETLGQAVSLDVPQPSEHPPPPPPPPPPTPLLCCRNRSTRPSRIAGNPRLASHRVIPRTSRATHLAGSCSSGRAPPRALTLADT
ncbi:initiator tRNA phosphoribosyl transferase-domain-containing protein [Sphaerosporella brunnea]|uniref:Initiator tRNA phosphoribosyl transferase-domain-containing protein n=1 Tax=Sphaerosporella brunnea TaxID=1250544 RepID=A0A5J5ERU6_9PEZI|nr:initiator tRNA phosphoribosyl transferase-domain-containing protein [Sphaerosporella brunnea]